MVTRQQGALLSAAAYRASGAKSDEFASDFFTAVFPPARACFRMPWLLACFCPAINRLPRMRPAF
jgi:hypothetical protein